MTTVLNDSPISVPSGKSVWRPQNYDMRFHGEVTVREALAHSYNIPAVRAAIDAGVPNVIRTALSIGVESKLEPYPSISLGSFEVTPLEIAYAYSVFANLGVKAEPISILAVATLVVWSKIFLGPPKKLLAPDLAPRERGVLVVLVLMLLAIGLVPQVLMSPVNEVLGVGRAAVVHDAR
jgi:hypothetical protein